MSSCSLSMPFTAQSTLSYNFLKSFYQLKIGPLSPLIFFGTSFVPLEIKLTFQMVIQFVNKYSSEYLLHKRLACCWPKVGGNIPVLSVFRNKYNKDSSACGDPSLCLNDFDFHVKMYMYLSSTLAVDPVLRSSCCCCFSQIFSGYSGVFFFFCFFRCVTY